jgi:hypothetical protein
MKLDNWSAPYAIGNACMYDVIHVLLISDWKAGWKFPRDLSATSIYKQELPAGPLRARRYTSRGGA